MSIVHRDIKPDNIGFTADGTLKLFDFGLSTCIIKCADDNHECYKMTGNTGTLRYMAPEVALGLPYNQTVDVYSFSVIFWQLLSSRVPFLRLGKNAFIKNVVENDQRPALDPRWPLALQQLLTRCWDKDKSVRLNSQAILQELAGLIHEESQKQFTRMNHSHSILLSGPNSATHGRIWSIKDILCGHLILSRTSPAIKLALLLSFLVIFIVTISFVIVSSGLDVVAGVLLLISSTVLYSLVLSYESQLRRLRIFSGSYSNSPSLLLKVAQSSSSSKHQPVSASELSSTHSADRDRDDPECTLALPDATTNNNSSSFRKTSRMDKESQAVCGGPTFNPLFSVITR